MSKELSTLGAVIKAAYEGELDTNALTDALLAVIQAAVVKDGSVAMTGNLDMGTKNILNARGLTSDDDLTIQSDPNKSLNLSGGYINVLGGQAARIGADYDSGTMTDILFLNGGDMLIHSRNVTVLKYESIAENWTFDRPFKPMRVTTSEKNALTNLTAGLIVFDTTLKKLCVYSGTAWETVTSV